MPAQPPAFPLLAGLVMWIGTHIGVSLHTSINLVADAAIAAVILGGTLVVRALGVARKWELVLLGGLIVDPLFAHGLAEFFHPQDIYELGLVLAGMGLAIRSRWVGAGICLGVAFAFKQTALLALLPMTAFAPGRDRVRFAGSALGAAAALYLPLCLTNRGSVGHILTGPTAGGSTGTLVAQIGLSASLKDHIARGGPILATIAVTLGLLLWSRHRAPGATAMVAAVVTCLTVRVLFESDPLAYYLIPASVGVVIYAAATRRWIVPLAWLLAAVVWFDTHLSSRFSQHDSGWVSAAVYPLVGLVAIWLAWLLVRDRNPGGPEVVDLRDRSRRAGAPPIRPLPLNRT